MRRLLLLLAAVVALAAGAQERIGAHMSLGGKAGVALSKQMLQPSVPQSLLTGITLGAQWRYIEERHFGIIAELNLVQRGWKENYDGYDFAFQRRLTYIELPVMTHIYFGSERARFYFNAGPQVGFMLGESTTANFNYSDLTTVDDFPATRQVDQFTLPVKHKFDYGICAGMGMEVAVARRHSVNIEGRVTYGLHDVFANRKSDTFSGSAGLCIAVTAGYWFKL